MKKVVLFLCLMLFSACGWEPLYVQKDAGWFAKDASTVSEMAQIKVETIPERFGQQLRNHLLDALTPKGVPAQPRYRLSIIPSEVEIERQALREDITATRERTRYHVRYTMYDTDGNVLFEGDSLAFVSYDILSNPYSTTMAQKSAQQDAAKIIADDIILRIGAFFHTVSSEKKAE